VSNWDSSKDPRKATLQNVWGYCTKHGLVEEEGHPLDGFTTAHQYLLVEKKDAGENTKPTYWGTTHTDIPTLQAYVKNSQFYGNGQWSDRGWKVAYVFDLDTKSPIPTQIAFSN